VYTFNKVIARIRSIIWRITKKNIVITILYLMFYRSNVYKWMLPSIVVHFLTTFLFLFIIYMWRFFCMLNGHKQVKMLLLGCESVPWQAGVAGWDIWRWYSMSCHLPRIVVTKFPYSRWHTKQDIWVWSLPPHPVACSHPAIRLDFKMKIVPVLWNALRRI